MSKYLIPKLHLDSFCWQRWRIGYKIHLKIGIAWREKRIIEKKEVIKKYAVGYIEGERLICRPKENEMGVMFLIDNEFCWTHLRKKEFENVFFI